MDKRLQESQYPGINYWALYFNLFGWLVVSRILNIKGKFLTVLPYYLQNIMIGKSISALNWPRAFDKEFYRLAWIIISSIIALVTRIYA